MGSKYRLKKMRGSKRSSTIVSLAAMSVLTVAISANHQHPQSIANVTELQPSSSETHRQLEPRRKPPNVNHSKRMNALPPMLTKIDGVHTIQHQQTPPLKKKQPPYYPSMKTGTCLNDNDYPDYYLYDVKTYFFHSARECCERHFGNSVGSKGGGMLKDGGVGQCLAAIVGDKSVFDTAKMMPVMGSVGDQQHMPGMKTPGVEHHFMFNSAKTGKMPGASGAMPANVYVSFVNIDESNKMSKHPAKMFPKPPMHWSGSTSAVKGDKMNEKGSNAVGKKMPPKMYPKPPYISTSMGKSSKGETVTTHMLEDSKTSKFSETDMMPNNNSKYNMMPSKRPPPPELSGSHDWNSGWYHPPPNEIQHPHSKSGKAKSHKSAKSKSGKSKAGKAQAGASWWGSYDDFTYSPTYMPSENGAFQMDWIGGGNAQAQQNGRPNVGPRPGKLNAGFNGNAGPPGSGKPGWSGSGKTETSWWSDQMPEKPYYPTWWTGWEKPVPTWGSSLGSFGSGKPGWNGSSKPEKGWWSGQMPDKPNPPDWWTGWEKPVPTWGSSWNSWGYNGGWSGGSEWGNGWGVWGQSKPSSKPSASTPTAKPIGLFPTETLAPSMSPLNGMPTYSPSNPFPTYSPTPAGSTYSPTPAGSTYAPTPSVSTYAPSPSGITNSPTPYGITIVPTPYTSSYQPSTGGGGGFPTLNPTIGTTDGGDKTPSPQGEGMPTFSPTSTPTSDEDMTPSPTLLSADLCVWGSAYSSGLEDEGELVTVPLATGLSAIDASAGSKYSFIVNSSGVAMSAGYIENLDNYHGHLGIQPEDLSKGTNEFREISKVFDESEGKEVDPAVFVRVFAGVENSASSGIIHTILLDEEGRAYATGSNSKGQLCLGDELDRLIPTMISIEGVRIVDVAIGGEHTLLLDEDGNVYGCGSNELGQLGLSGSTVKTDIPLKVYTLPLVNSVSSGRDHSLFVAEDGVYVTGSNEYGQLCVDTDSESLFEPQALDIPFDIVSDFQAIFSSSYILFSDGSVIGCGNNEVGQLGNGEEKELVTFEPTVVQTENLIVGLIGAGSSARSVFFITDDEVYGTGLNTNGQLGVGDTENRNVPTILGFGSQVEITVLSAGEDHTLALCPPSEESIPTFSPTLGGNETQQPTLTPSYLAVESEPTISPSFLTTENATSSMPTLATYSPTPAGSSNAPTTYAPTAQGFNFFFWGNPESIGQESDENVTQPLTIDGDVLVASSGSRYSVIVMLDGSALSSGVVDSMDEYRGHLGVDQDFLIEGINAFQMISNVTDTNDTVLSAPAFHMIFAGVENTYGSGIMHTLLIDRDGNAYATGSNSQGQLCLGDEEDRFIPTQIPIEGPIIDAAVGSEHTLLLHQNGTVFVCGSNAVGEIGLGDDVSQTSSPVALDTITTVSSVSAGAEHSLLMANDGIYVMGDNAYGQLCSNMTDYLTSPNLIDIPIKNIVSFKAIKSSSFILYIDGSINSCGRNDFGQLGDGTYNDKILTEVVLGKAVRSIFTGPASESVFFLTDDETMYGTGLNLWGNLGTGDQENKAIPARVQFEEQVYIAALSPSDDHTIAFGLVTGSLPPSASPTPAPTDIITPSPTRHTLTFFFMGAPESLGQLSEEDVTKPLFVQQDSVRASAGSRYTMIVLQDGSVLAGGFVESKDNYQGHLGLGGIVIRGENDFKVIENVYVGDEIVDAPYFDLAFAGVENAPESGIIHTVLLDRDGNVYATGSNSQGQLCLGDEDERLIPTQVPVDGPIIDVAIGSEHTLLLHQNGTVFVCGSNRAGQVGLGDDVSQTSLPIILDVLSTVTSISAGAEHSLLMADDGIYVMGDNSYGQLCIDTDGEPIWEAEMLDTTITKVSAFEAIRSSSYILYFDGIVEACGKGDFGQLGDGTNQTTVSTTVELNGVVRLLGTGPSAESIFFVDEDELVYGAGLNERGNLGVGDQVNRAIPTRVKFPNEVMLSSLSAAEDHSVALGLITGTVIPTSAPTLASTTLTPSTIPTLSPSKLTENPSESPTGMPSPAPTFTTVTKLPTFSPSAGESALPTLSPAMATSAIPTPSPAMTTETTDLFAWGAQGSVGLPTGELASPMSLDKSVFDISAGSKYSLILLSDGTAQSAGYIESTDDYHGHLGLKGSDIKEGSNEFQDISTSYDNDEIITSPPFSKVFAGVEQEDAPGSIHSFLIDENGEAWAFGSNTYGELCLGDDVDRLIPTKVTLEGSILSVAIGAKHTLLLLDDGTVYACGSNENGQLALGESDTGIFSAPTKVEDVKDVRMIASGLDSSLFLASDGMYVAGENSFGQLCVETNQGSLFEPTLLEGVNADDVAAFEAIRTSSYILFKDGSVGACGQNNFGQLADGSYTDKTRVVVNPIPDDIPIRRLGVGPSSDSVFFVNDSGSLYASGLNDQGQLGVGDTDNRNTLTLVEYSGDFLSNQQLSASGDHTLSR